MIQTSWDVLGLFTLLTNTFAVCNCNRTGILILTQYIDDVIVRTRLLLCGRFSYGCDADGFVELVLDRETVSLESCCLPWTLLQMLACLPPQLLHFIVDQHSRLMWFFLNHTKHCPVLRICDITHCPTRTWRVGLPTIWAFLPPHSLP